jgi:hypothetical protein
VQSGILRGIFEALAADLEERGLLDIREAFIEGSFAPAKKGAPKLGRQKRGKGTRVMAIAESHGLPVGLCIESASPHEVKLVDSTLVERVIPEAPQNLVGDNAYDSDKLDAELDNTESTS